MGGDEVYVSGWEQDEVYRCRLGWGWAGMWMDVGRMGVR